MNNLSVFQGFYNRGLILGYFFLLWSSDSFAYVFGNLLGKTKLFERISPKKSWEGFIGGLISTVAISFLLAYFNPEIATIHWVVIAVLIVVCGSLGDLTESLLKRSLNVKDSGSILPGHGGMLDRFDGLLLSAPFVFAYITICC
jgi:phosphatidate cytidylyltransferase